MSEVAFVNRLGDALDAMAAAPASAGVDRRHRRVLRRLPRGRSRLLVGLAVVLIGGGAATAATLLSSQTPTVIAARGLTCMSGTPRRYTGGTYDVGGGAGTPAQACAAVLQRPASTLIACNSTRFGVVVYYRDASSHECAQAGMTPLPPGYAAAAKRVATLIRDLNHLQASRNCFSPAALAAGTDAALARLGFRDWRAVVQKPTRLPNLVGWHCAQYPTSGARYSDAAAAVSTDDNSGPGTVAVLTGPSRDQDRASQALNRMDLLARTGARCYSADAVEALVRSAVRATYGASTPVSFAARSEPHATEMGVGRQPRYAVGCATLVATELTAVSGVQALIWQKGWPAMGAGDNIPSSAYKPALPGKH
jgi:hypothetical protein